MRKRQPIYAAPHTFSRLGARREKGGAVFRRGRGCVRVAPSQFRKGMLREMHDELVGLLPEEVSRRGFIAGSLAAGFALAVQPVAAQTVITTDAEGLEAGEVKVPVRDGEMPAYRAMPAGGKNLPVALVVQEIFGVHEHIKDVCRRFA